MHVHDFIHDMATIMVIAGLVTLLFNRFKQPVVLGYLVAGIIIGPYMASGIMIHDEKTVSILGELGVIFLMFSLGLEFSLKKLAKIGAPVFITAFTQISLMMMVGYYIGHWFGWNEINCLFLGAMLSMSSTTIIVKAIGELGLKNQKFSHIIFGALIVEDIIAIGIIALLSGIAKSGTIDSGNIVSILGQLSLFIIIVLVFGLLTVPRLLKYVAKYKSNEMLLVSTLGLCFGLCLVVMTLNYSVALGAFMMGAIIAEAKPLHQIERLIEPLRDTFCAVFFVTIGMMFNPKILIQYWEEIIVITLAVVLGKIIVSSIGAFISGEDGRTSLKVGMGLSQIGEFSFIIASVGVSLGVTRPELYPIIIAVSTLTTLSTPYLIRLSDPCATYLGKNTKQVGKLFNSYTNWIRKIQSHETISLISKLIFKIISQIVVNTTIIIAVFIASAYAVSNLDDILFGENLLKATDNYHRSMVLGSALILSLPFIIASYRKLKALGMIFSELIVPSGMFGKNTYNIRRIIFETIPILMIIWIMSMVFSVSQKIMPAPLYTMTLGFGALIIALIFWKPLVKFQSWLQIQLVNTMNDSEESISSH